MVERAGPPNLAADVAGLEARLRALEGHHHPGIAAAIQAATESSGGSVTPHGASIVRPTDQSIPNNSLTEVNFTEILFQVGGVITPDLPGNRLVIETRCLVTVAIQGAFEPDSDSNGRAIYLKWNDSEYHAFDSDTAENQAGFVMGMNAVTHRLYEEGDFLTMEVLQSSGGSLDLNGTAYSPILSVVVDAVLG